MVGYVGGKAGSGGYSGPAKAISRVIHSVNPDARYYIEPFLGGGSTWEYTSPQYRYRYAGDAALDLMLMWKAARDGWVPPTEVTEEQYRELKAAPSSALRGFVGFGCSWGGKWFGGYARSVTPNGRVRNFAANSSARVVRIATTTMKGPDVKLRFCSFQDWDDVPLTDTVVYADPPYAGTLGYPLAAEAVGKFDHDKFWHSAEWWVDEGADVFVSEYTAPEGWVVLAEIPHYRSLGKRCGHARRCGFKERVQEKLWVKEDRLAEYQRRLGE